MNLGKIPNLIVDIGGGSVEFIIGDSNEIYWKKSLELGGQRLMDKFMSSDPISYQATMDLHNYLHEQLQPLQDAIAQFNPKVMVGVSGTFDTLSEIYLRKTGNFESQQDIEAQSEYALPTEFVLQQAKDFIAQNRAQRMAIAGMIPLRVDMIVVATCLIRYVLQISDIQKIRVSTYSLKEGILSDFLERI
jgi:exopolyphosphatase/guanosine-5'-triphosphate,3'-diphosphate pyrophosphatase